MPSRLSLLIGLCVVIGGANSASAQAQPSLLRTPREQRIDAAVVKALDFISRKQQPSGAWIADSVGESTAATSLAILAFMAAGHLPGEGPYGDQINRGVRWVLDHQERNGMLIHKRSHGPMYSHGISTLMLAEVLGMMDSDADRVRVRNALERAVRLILEAQSIPKLSRHSGGWRYQISSRDSDLSVTGWQLLALRAAKDVGCDVPVEAIENAIDYVKQCAVRNFRGFSYQPNGGPTPTRSGTGIVCLEVCGDHHSNEALGAAEYLLQEPLKLDDSYFYYGVYYCSVGLFKVGGRYWDNSRPPLEDILLNAQRADGSWSPVHHTERRQGPIYATTLSVLGLAVEYRYLPIYQR